MKAGEAGITVANKAQAIYANYLEKSEKTKLAMFMEVAERAEAQIAADSKNANAYYFMAYALGRYSQGISVAKALAQGLGSKVKAALETAIKLAPKHADAHIALGAFPCRGHRQGRLAARPHPGREQGRGPGDVQDRAQAQSDLGDRYGRICERPGDARRREKMKEATKLYEDAAACTPLDAMERLDVEMAKAELED